VSALSVIPVVVVVYVLLPTLALFTTVPLAFSSRNFKWTIITVWLYDNLRVLIY
jgi:hypothetical protein